MILVTGGAGKVGTPLVRALVDRGEEVRILTRRTDPRVLGVDVVKGNVLDVYSVKKAVEGTETIYHLASLLDTSQNTKGMMREVNVTGTRNLLEAAGDRRFIYLSSTMVYGSNMRQNPATESTPYNPDGLYGRTKMAAEKLVLWKGGVVIRSPTVYGEGFNAGLIPVLSHIDRGEMKVIGSGDNVFQWIHISDLVQALLLAKDNGKPGVYLVAGDEKRTQRELLSLFARYLHVGPPKRRTSVRLALAAAGYRVLAHRVRGGSLGLSRSHINRITSNRLYDTSKAKNELGFEPRIGYEQGARELVEEYLVYKGLG
jgi:nucleoside-diphosphate-sugar epimerase